MTINYHENLEGDIKATKNILTKLQNCGESHLDDKRILGIVSTCAKGRNYLYSTLSKLFAQCAKSDIAADIIVGFNNGSYNQEFVEQLSNHIGLKPIIFRVTKRTSATTAGSITRVFNQNDEKFQSIYSNFLENSKDQKNRIIIIDQPESIFAAGKIRMLADIYTFLVDSIISGTWRPPALTLLFDSESHFHSINATSGNIDLDSNGIKELLHLFRSKPEIDVVGSRNIFLEYSEENNKNNKLEPCWNNELFFMYNIVNRLHSQYDGFGHLPGGGTLGKTPILISIMHTIVNKYIGARAEDIFFSVIVTKMKCKVHRCRNIISSNRAISVRDKEGIKACVKQFLRWKSSTLSVIEQYGKENMGELRGYENFEAALIKKELLGKKPECRSSSIQEIFTNFSLTIKDMPLFLKIGKRLEKAIPDPVLGTNPKAQW